MARLFVIEDHAAIIVAGFKRLFYLTRDGIEVAGEANTVEETIASANPDTFDIFILDLWLANRKPIENIRALKAAFPGKPVIIYTAETSPVWKQRMFAEKAGAYITKTSPRSEIRNAIETVARGEAYFRIDLDELDKDQHFFSQNNKLRSYSVLEQEILRLLAQGHQHKKIAQLVGKSQSRVEQILRKLRTESGAVNNFDLLSKLPEVIDVL